MQTKKILPTKPNLIALTEVFCFDYTEYKNISLVELNKKNKMHLSSSYDLFEAKDKLHFYAIDIGDKKHPRYERYLFYETNKNEFFCCQLNDYIGRDLINFCGAGGVLKMLPMIVNNSIKIYKYWKKELNRSKLRELN